MKLLIIALLSLATAPAWSQNTGSFTLTTKVNGDGTLTPTLTWSTTPAATSCVASGDSAWAGSKTASGTQALAAFPTSSPKAYALLCNWPGDTQALLAWTVPTQNTDGSTLTNLAGFRVQWGKSATVLDQAAQIPNPAATGYTVTGLTPAMWFFGVRAYTSQGAESSMSNTVNKVITGPVEWSQSTGVKVPKAPVLE